MAAWLAGIGRRCVPLPGPPELRVASGEARARRGRQRLALLEAALPGQGTLLLLVFPLLVLLLLFLHLGRRVKESVERGSRGQRRPRCPGWDPCPRHSPAKPRAGGVPGQGCPRRWPCGAPRRGRSGARFGGRCTASGGWRRPSEGTRARLRRDECGRGVAYSRGWPLSRLSRGLSQDRGPYPGPGRFGAG